MFFLGIVIGVIGTFLIIVSVGVYFLHKDMGDGVRS